MADADPPAADADFAAATVRLGGQAALALGWTPDTFWAATPAELAAIVRAALPDTAGGLGSADLAKLMEAFPEG